MEGDRDNRAVSKDEGIIEIEVDTDGKLDVIIKFTVRVIYCDML